MLKTAYRLTANAFNATFRPKALIHPLMVVYHITNLCNLRCFYCEDFSADKNHLYASHELSTEQVKEILRILRKKFDYIYITGGEPYVRKDLEELIEFMKKVLKYKRISLNTNGLTVEQKPDILKNIRDLVVSVDSLNLKNKDEIIGCKQGTAQKIFDNLQWAGALQKKYGFELSLNCVVTAHTIEDARGVLEYAIQNNMRFSCIPQNVQYSFHPAFKGNKVYQDFIKEVLDRKKETKLISGTRYFFRNILSLEPFACYPQVIGRITATGDLYWPCRPLHTFAGNLLEIGSYDKTVKEGIKKYGILNACNKNCQMRCYIESSVLVKHPLSLVREFFGKPGKAAPPPLTPQTLPPQLSPAFDNDSKAWNSVRGLESSRV